MKILVLYHQNTFIDRTTIDEHLYAIKHYAGAPSLYVNANFPMPLFLHKVNFDLIVFHFTFLRLRWEQPQLFSKMLERYRNLKAHPAYKLAMAQDEFACPDRLGDFLREFKVDRLQTCFLARDWETVYPKSIRGSTELETVLTGYIDNQALNEMGHLKRPHRQRKIDIGYRARRVPFWVGEFGTLKWRITDVFKQIHTSYSDLKFDLSNEDHDAFIGPAWSEFLFKSRVTIGCEGGGSLLDRDGSIRKNVDNYVRENPDRSFEEVRELFFKKEDNNISLYALSPRHLEACLTRTCQILVEGDYNGVLEANRHYIPLKRDFSNIQEVMQKVRDIEFCEAMAERSFHEVAANPKYNYETYVKAMLALVKHQPVPKNLWWYIAFSSAQANRVFGFFKILLTGWLREQFKAVLRKLGVFPLAKYYYHKYKSKQ